MPPTSESPLESSLHVPSRRQVLHAGGAALAAALLRPALGHHSTEPTSRVDESRLLHSLNGVWDFLPSSGTPAFPPPSTGWATIPVPAEWNMTAGQFATSWDAYDLFETPPEWDQVDTAWYRRTVDVPAASRGKRIVLRFEAVNFESTVFLNGVQVAHNLGGLLPFEADVTDQVSFGETNTIHVLVRSPNSAARGSGGFLYPAGSWWGQLAAGIWQDVWLLQRNAVSTVSTSVVTSVRSKMLRATTVLRNDGPKAASVWVDHVVLDGGHSHEKTGRSVTVPAGGTASVSVSVPWRDARLWSPEDPHLYELRVDLRERSSSPVLDSTSTRFGFREVWVDGDRLMLNGAPILLRGDSWHYMGSIQNSRAYATAWMKLAKAAGVNYMRLHAMPYPPVYYDVADELGMLIVGESAIYGSSGNYALGESAFWDNAAAHVTSRIERDINHPSIIAWSVENEMLAAFGQSWKTQVAALKPVATAADPTRPAYFEGDGDPNGAGDLQSTHYPVEMTTNSTAIPESGQVLAPGHARAGDWDRTKPFVISEFSAMYYANPADVSTLGGPEAYASLDGLWSAHALAVRAQIEGFRYAGVSGISPWNLVWYGMRPLPFDPAKTHSPNAGGTGPQLKQVGRWAATLNPGIERDLPRWEPNPIHDAIARVFSPIAAFALDYRTHYWGGGQLSKVLAVYNSTPRAARLTVHWSLTVPRGRTVSGHQKLSLDAIGQTEVTAAVTVPSVTKPTTATWTVTVTGGDCAPFVDTLEVTLYPRSTLTTRVPGAGSAAVLEKAGSTATADALSALGMTTRIVADLSTMPDPGEVLVVGEGALATLSAADTDRVKGFVTAGGTVLVLAQQSVPQILPWPVFGTGSAQTVSHVASPHHPVLDGLGSDDLRWWQTTNEVVVGTQIAKPRFGSLRSLADAGTALAGSALAEAAFGTGTYLLCQYPVVAASNDEPVAATLLRNLVAYVSGRTPTTPKAAGVLASAPASAVAATLQAAATDPATYTTLDPASLADIEVLLVDASPGNEDALASLAAAAGAVTSWVKGGGTLWVNGAQPGTLATLSGVLPSGVTLEAVDAAHQFAGAVTGRSAVTDGLTNADLSWPTGGSPVAAYTVDGPRTGVSLVDTVAVDWNAFARGAEQNKYGVAMESQRGFTPGSALWLATVGSGRVLIDQIGWPTDRQLPTQVGVAASIAAGLGVEFVVSAGSGLIPTAGWSATSNPASSSTANGFDRNPSTRWSTDALQQPGMYYQLNMGTPHTVNKIVWDTSQSAGDAPKGLQLDTSVDGVTFTTVLTLPDTSSIVNAGVMTITLDPPVQARFLKFIDTASAPGNYMSLHELYVYGTDVSSGTSLPTGQWFGFSNPQAENPVNAYDRNPSTRWSTDTLAEPGMYYGLNIGASHHLTKIVWDSSGSPGDCPKGLQLDVSADGTTYETVMTVPDTTSLISGGVMTILLSPPVDAQFFKVITTKSSTGYMSVHEIYVYADDE